jgi:hypothetical protein
MALPLLFMTSSSSPALSSSSSSSFTWSSHPSASAIALIAASLLKRLVHSLLRLWAVPVLKPGTVLSFAKYEVITLASWYKWLIKLGCTP